MRKLFNEFFYISKHGKVREKVMLTRLATTITIVIMCLAAMSITAYAYFSYNITSGSNVIKAANFATEVGVKIESSSGDNVEVRTSNHISHQATLTGGTTYFITLQHTPQSTTQTGFMIITAEKCDVKYHTQQIGRNEDGSSKTVSFEINPTADTVITFYSHWGTSSCYPGFKDITDNDDRYIQSGETITMIVNGVTTPPTQNQTENNTPPAESTTTPPATQTEPPATETPVTSTTAPESTGTGEPENTTDPESTETSAPANTTEPTSTEPVTSEPTETIATTETQPVTENLETTGAPTTEANKHNEE